MSTVQGLCCDGCGTTVTWIVKTGEPRHTKSALEKAARRFGWEAPDKLGDHRCWNCRSQAGRDLWRRRTNLRLGLGADYGRGRCTCKNDGTDDFCSKAGHPGVNPLWPGSETMRKLEARRG